MSYILEALKKSEQDRHAAQQPSFISDGLMHKPRSTQAYWPLVLVILLLINAALLIYFFSWEGRGVESNSNIEIAALPSQAIASNQNMQPSSDKTTALTNQNKLGTEPNLTKEAEQAVTRSVVGDVAHSRETIARSESLITPTASEMSVNKQSQNQIIASTPPLSERPSETTPEKVELKQESERPLLIEPAQNTAGKISGEPYSDLYAEAVIGPEDIANDQSFGAPISGTEAPTFSAESQFENPLEARYSHISEFDVSFQRSVPSISFNSHIYSDEPSARRVMINNIFLQEGDEFQGLSVVAIRSNDIILEKDGNAFKLNILRDWIPPK